MGEIIMRNCDLREFRVWVNLPSLIQQVRVPIRRVITPIRGVLDPIRRVMTLIQGLPNPIRRVVPVISHAHLYPQHLSHLHPPSLSFSCTTLSSSQNTKLSHPSLSLHVMIISWHRVQVHTVYSIHRVQYTPSKVYTECSIHRVQNTPSTVYTEYSVHRVQHTPCTASMQDCLSSPHSHNYELTSECSFSLRRASLHNWPPSASSLWQLNGTVSLSHSHGCKLTNRWEEPQHPACHPLTASQYSSKLAQLRPPSSDNRGLQVHLQSRSITVSKFAQSWPPSAYLQTRSIMTSKCISKLAQSWPPSVSLNSLDYSLQVHTIMASKCISKLTRSRPRSVSPNTLDYGLQVRTITASKCIYKLAWSQPPTVCPNMLYDGLQVHLQTRSITASEWIPEFTQSSFSGAPRIALKHRLQSVQIYPV